MNDQRTRLKLTARWRAALRSCVCFTMVSLALCSLDAAVVSAQTANTVISQGPSAESIGEWVSDLSGPAGIGSAWKTMVALSVLSLAPAILLMTTSFVRISVVLALLRQAIGTQMLPSNQVITSLALFMTVLIMSPIWKQVYRDAITPYSESEITASEAWSRGIAPVRTFMSHQIERAGNGADVYLFYDHLVADGLQETAAPQTYDDVPIEALLPAFVLSELKTAFLIGFQVFLPFLVIDLVVASVTTSMGMMMLPPVMVSLPMKLLLFVLVDGWHLVVGMLLQSFG